LHAEIIERYGRLDAAVNNAGISDAYGRIGDFTTEELERIFRINVYGVFWGIRAQVKLFLPQKKGRIVNIASAAGLHGVPGNGIYAGSKHAVRLSLRCPFARY
jgi:NAD(P)-dependent dehydrogenase (short-subunit alcohol dehydrogenase family)